MSSVRVAVRVRPLNKREQQISSKKIIQMEGNRTSIYKPLAFGGDKLEDGVKTFSYDYSYDSSDKGSPTFVSQEKLFQDLGSEVLKAAFKGFNACMFAYGQTGSGKSYTMMGDEEDKGLIPRICEGLFLELSHRSKSEAVSFRTEASYLEIYNERVQDLLKRSPSTDNAGLKVREHPKDGPYVENLSKHVVHNHSDMEDLICRGDANRTKASTGMNDFSSRSHAIFTIKFTQKCFNMEFPHETLSKIHLVDLAGSERANATHTTGIRLKEGANINKSLVTLGSVISALANPSMGGQSAKKIFIPYRDSVLTWLLKDSLGGNSLTTMIATISPADVNYGETLSTLRYANRAKNIMNTPTVNEDGSVKVIRELQAEVNRLRTLLAEASQVFHGELSTSVKVEAKLCQNETEAVALNGQWSSRCEKDNFLQEETVALRKEGSGVVLDCQLPHLIGIDEDLLSTGIILYYLKEGRTLIGSDEASCSQDIVLHGPGLLREHCVLENHAGTVTLFPQDGALCSVNGSVVKDPQQLKQGSIIQLGNGTILRFNHPAEVTQLREKQAQSKPLSAFNLTLTDLSKSTENPSKRMLKNSRSYEDFDHKEVGQKQKMESLTGSNCNKKSLSSENIVVSNQIEEKSHFSQMGVLPVESGSKDPHVCLKSTLEKLMTTAIPRRDPDVPCTGFELDRDALQGGVSTRDGQKQERDLCHKSGPRLMSERPQRKAQSGTAVASYMEEKVWSGDASLQQTTVLGPGDGCGMKPEGNANDIQGVVTDCYKRRPDSGGSSLGSMSHLQRSGGGSFMSVLPQTSTHSQLDGKPLNSQACCPPKDSEFEGHFSCKEMDKSGGLQEMAGVCVTDSFEAKNSGLASLLSRVSWIVQDATRRLWKSPTILQQITGIKLQPIGSQWSSHVVSLVRESNVLSVVKDSQVSSIVRGSFVFSLFRDSHIFSVVKELPFIQHIQMNITQHLQPEETVKMIQDFLNPDNTPLSAVTPAQTMVEELQGDVQQIPEDISRRDWQSPQKQDRADIHVKQGDENVTMSLPSNYLSEMDVTHEPRRGNQAMEDSKIVHIGIQTLIEFPDSLVKLQTLPLQDMMDTLQSIIPNSVFTSKRIVALQWLNVATCSQPEPQPALLILMETGLYTLTINLGFLVLLHHLPLMQLREIHVGLAGHSLRLMGTTEESMLAVYTHSQKHTKQLCWTILDVICPGDIRILHYPLLHEDLMKMSLDCQFCLPDLLLDAGLKVYCRFQKSLIDLVYLIHCNMDGEAITLGEMQLLLYASVAVHISPGSHSKHLAQFFLTDTHLGLVREDAVFHPAPQSVTVEARHAQFRDLTLRQNSDVRCILVHDEDKSGSVRLDVILANVRGRGHPESVTKAATSSEHALNSSLHAEVWKLTFSCSTEAACLINHLSNV
ncbi:uncharacterized protein kif16bb isoform X2 [Melanotaenia boesemani]|uniref:uncharacterized protein kif16bb isoform X2 n=1 Tax=Melanotaenia boesemani TaxID=1250792 RepID=UPI001C05197F|nr:uncharacterized protein kif16bb isoform X2 [Melanotaenia boesemani]